MFSMIQAGSIGLPFIAVRGLLGTDLLSNRPDLMVIENPFHGGENVVVAQPLKPDVAVFHALKADRWGNTLTPGLRDDLMLARASRQVVVTAEEIVDTQLNPADARGNTFLPAIDVDMVVHAPFGAHPCGCGELYPADHSHILEYLQAAKEEKTFATYLEKYVYDLNSHQDYLAKFSSFFSGRVVHD